MSDHNTYIPGTDVQGLCPGCGRRSLFLGAGGYVTCRIRECPDPTAAADVLDRRPLDLQLPQPTGQVRR